MCIRDRCVAIKHVWCNFIAEGLISPHILKVLVASYVFPASTHTHTYTAASSVRNNAKHIHWRMLSILDVEESIGTDSAYFRGFSFGDISFVFDSNFRVPPGTRSMRSLQPAMKITCPELFLVYADGFCSCSHLKLSLIHICVYKRSLILKCKINQCKISVWS